MVLNESEINTLLLKTREDFVAMAAPAETNVNVNTVIIIIIIIIMITIIIKTNVKVNTVPHHQFLWDRHFGSYH